MKYKFSGPYKAYCGDLSFVIPVICYLHKNSQTVKKGAAHAKKAA